MQITLRLITTTPGQYDLRKNGQFVGTVSHKAGQFSFFPENDETALDSASTWQVLRNNLIRRITLGVGLTRIAHSTPPMDVVAEQPRYPHARTSQTQVERDVTAIWNSSDPTEEFLRTVKNILG